MVQLGEGIWLEDSDTLTLFEFSTFEGIPREVVVVVLEWGEI